MSQQTFVMDPRLPVSADASEDDPNHPKNVCKGLAMLNNQALADTKYDIHPPPRVEEKFANPLSRESRWKMSFLLFVVGVMLSIAIICQTNVIKLAAIVVLMFCIKYTVYMLENRTV